MIKGSFTQDASIGEYFEPRYQFRVTKEHASVLYRVLRETRLTPADWLSRVLIEEMSKIGYSAELPTDDEKQLTIDDRIKKGQSNE